MLRGRDILLLVIVAGVLGVALAGWMRHQSSELDSFGQPVATEAKPAPASLPLVGVADVLRALKLVTVEIRTSVQSASADESWRGDVNASVQAPVTLYFGSDLSELRKSDVLPGPLSGRVLLRVPEPRLLAVEVASGSEAPNVKVSGLRLRDVAGEYHLGLARTRLHEQARRLALSEAQRAEVETLTRQQLARLAGVLLARDAAEISVEFRRSEVADAERPGNEGAP